VSPELGTKCPTLLGKFTSSTPILACVRCGKLVFPLLAPTISTSFACTRLFLLTSMASLMLYFVHSITFLHMDQVFGYSARDFLSGLYTCFCN
jgi:hypothetical protein